MLEQTRRRVSLAVPEKHTLTVINRAHERFYRKSLADVAESRLVIQPEARGTAAAIVDALLRAATVTPMASVAVFPSDHYVDNDAAFMRHVELAFDVVEQRPELTVLLGITPDLPESGYGWIEPGQSLSPACQSIFAVRRFWEKPPESMAQKLLGLGSLWNSFVMVGRLSSLLGLVIMAKPQLYSSFAAIRAALGTGLEDQDKGLVRQACGSGFLLRSARQRCGKSGCPSGARGRLERLGRAWSRDGDVGPAGSPLPMGRRIAISQTGNPVDYRRC